MFLKYIIIYIVVVLSILKGFWICTMIALNLNLMTIENFGSVFQYQTIPIYQRTDYKYFKRGNWKGNTDISNTDDLQTRHNDYNFVNKPAIKSYLEKFPYKQILSNWNSLSIDLKSTADEDAFKQMLKEMYLSNYECDSQCLGPCYSCTM